MANREKRGFRIEPRILVLFLLLGIPTLLIGHLILVSGAQDKFREVVAAYSSHEADRLQSALINYVEDLSVQVANLALVAQVQAVVRKGNSRRPNEARFAEEIQAIEQQWRELTGVRFKLLENVLENEAAVFLRQYNQVVATFREILVTDSFGRLVAASGKTTDYFQADEAWWRVAYLEGKGQRFISDIQYDHSARVHCIEIAEPVRDTSTGEVIGIVKAIIDADALFGMLKSIRFGPSRLAVLIRSDGSVVTDPESSEAYPFVQQVRAGLELNRDSVEAPEEDPVVFVGLPQSAVKDRIPELDWYLIVQAPYDEVFRPFRQLRSWFIYIVVFGAGLILLLSLIFTWILSKPVIETETHLDQV